MFAKTFCKPGDFVAVAPIGLQLTLQYNHNGLLEKIYKGDKKSEIDVTEKLYEVFQEKQYAPHAIPTKGGTTWVTGVFTCDALITCEGKLPDCISDEILSNVETMDRSFMDELGFIFYAGALDSLAVSFNNIQAIENWFRVAQFNLLPRCVVASNTSEEAILESCKYRNPDMDTVIGGIYIFADSEYDYVTNNLSQIIVSEVETFLDSNGYVKVKLFDGQGNESITVPYSDVVKFNIQKEAVVIIDDDARKVIDVNYVKQPTLKVDKVFICPVCNKKYFVPESGNMTCDDPHCLSTQWPYICHMLNVLELPELSWDKYMEYVKEDNITYPLDIFLLDEYKDLKLSVSLSKLFESLVPVEICTDSNLLHAIVSNCSNSIKTFRYYINNPKRIAIDFNLTSPQFDKIIRWLSDSYNVRMIETMLESNDVTIVETKQKFEGAPLLRNKTIALTGKFRHGDIDNIDSIIASYAGKTTVSHKDKFDCVVAGDIQENIDGEILSRAKSRNIPIYSETAFFEHYGIDEDLEKNLL